MENVVPSEQGADTANQCGEDAWGLEDIVTSDDQSTIATREAIAALGVKFRSAGLTFPGTPVEIIASS